MAALHEWAMGGRSGVQTHLQGLHTSVKVQIGLSEALKLDFARSLGPVLVAVRRSR